VKCYLESQSIDTSAARLKKDLLNILIQNQSIMNNNVSFEEAFNEFIRDYVLSAGVAEYIIQVDNSDIVFQWISSWVDNLYWGQRYKFQIHTKKELTQKSIDFGRSGNPYEDKIYFPSSVIFLVASSLNPVYELNGLEEIEYHRTSEFEIISRQNSDLLEIRGDYHVIKDFVATAILDNNNPLSMAGSVFIGEQEDIRHSLIKVSRRHISIDTLRSAINGKFLSITAIVDGTKANKININVDELQDWQEETEPLLRNLLKKIQPKIDKGRILFEYNSKKYSFMITKTGGLRFYEYVPEEVLTYLLYWINKLA